MALEELAQLLFLLVKVNSARLGLASEARGGFRRVALNEFPKPRSVEPEGLAETSPLRCRNANFDQASEHMRKEGFFVVQPRVGARDFFEWRERGHLLPNELFGRHVSLTILRANS